MLSGMGRSLRVLDERIDARARATREEHPWWPCAAGCDHCCRSLARLPELRAPEWERLRDAIERLPDDVRAVVGQRARDAPASSPVICPLLDRERGVCLVYDARPIACRTYGFYVERDGGLHCRLVTDAVARHDTPERPVTWGNGEAIARDLETLGEPRSLAEWLTSRRG
jgi:Fe-S-cluster containining protein